jgi:sugar transferase (PEP-CTERM/EpsH1 system associated)
VKILAITPRFPYPLEKGDKLRAYHQLHALSAHHEVVLVALTEAPVPAPDLAMLEAFCSRVHVVQRTRLTTALSVARAAVDGTPLQVGYFRSRAGLRRVAEIVAEERPDRLYCQLVRAAPYGRGSSVPSTLDYQDAFSAAALRHANTASPWLRPVLRAEARRLRRYEERVAGWFDHRVVISEQDRELLGLRDATSVDVLPNGVDTEYFAPVPAPADQRAISFVGNMGYAPNVDAAGILVEQVLPLVQARRPGTDVLLAGARPARSVLRLAGPSVEVSGWLDDIRDGYARGRVMVAPLQIGAGQQNKILEAMSMGVPCVTTELVNRAIGATPGEEIMVATDPAAMADAVIELLGSEERRAELGARAREFVTRRYSWPAVGIRLAEILGAD